MKKFLLFPLLVTVLSGCGYGSKFEAIQACEKWSKQNENFGYVEGRLFNPGKLGHSRLCYSEDSTRIILGMEKYKGSRSQTVKKRFRY